MRLNKLAKKIFAAGLAVSLMMANAGMSFAAYDTPATIADNTVTIKTTLTVTDSSVKSPYAKVTYTASNDVTEVTGTADNVEIKKGVGTPTIADAVFTAGASTTGTEFEVSPAVSFSGISFSEPGVYRYKITCALDTSSDPAVKIKDAEVTTKYLDVYIYDNNGTLEYAGSVLHNSDEVPARDGTTPAEAQKTDGLKLEYETTDLTVKKQVTGNQGNKNKAFPFTVEVQGINGTVFNVKIGDQESTATVENGKATITANLKHDDTIVVSGIGKNSKYTVTETDNGDYTTSYTIGNADAVKETTTGEQTLADSTTVTFENHREGTIPTGVILDSAPFILIIGLAAAALIFTAARKKVR